MDNESLLLSSMRSLVAVCHLILHIPLFFCCVLSADALFLLQLLQKCQTGMGRLDAAEARAAVWAAEKEELLKSLAAKDATLAEEASKNADLFAELDAARALAEHLKEKAKEAADQNAHLSYELDEVRLALSRQEEDMQMLRGTNKRLTSERRLAERRLEMALEGKAAELELALRGQEAKLKEEYQAEHDAVMNEEVDKLAADYKARLPPGGPAVSLCWLALLGEAEVLATSRLVFFRQYEPIRSGHQLLHGGHGVHDQLCPQRDARLKSQLEGLHCQLFRSALDLAVDSPESTSELGDALVLLHSEGHQVSIGLRGDAMSLEFSQEGGPELPPTGNGVFRKRAKPS
ncbi:hypothetical protein MRB53_023197 [Persea americana]|uniref:Uncharacterized protein n=1 Tax=Persea americana TaxID=3435 RepID=A0ACC2L8R3_PERAE|nr:hypothetical protein MRB53_023197 [Persea americana]